MTTKAKNVKSADEEVAGMFALGAAAKKAAGVKVDAKKPADKKAAVADKKAAPKKTAVKKEAAVKAPTLSKFKIYYDGKVIDTVEAKTLKAAQKQADGDWEEKVLAVAADADAEAVKEAKRESKKLAAEEEDETPKKRGRAKIERTEKELEERHTAHLIRKNARRKCRRWLRANDVQQQGNIVVQPVDDSFVFAVATETKTVYLGLDEEGEIEKINATKFKAAQAAAAE